MSWAEHFWNAVCDEKVKVLRAVRSTSSHSQAPLIVRGQYTAGQMGGKPAVGYRDEPHVAADSAVETFIALKLFIDNWRWSGVPFYIRTGKALASRLSHV